MIQSVSNILDMPLFTTVIKSVCEFELHRSSLGWSWGLSFLFLKMGIITPIVQVITGKTRHSTHQSPGSVSIANVAAEQ